MGPPAYPLGRRTRLHRRLDRRAPHRALGAASRARLPGGRGAPADGDHPARPRRLPAALPPPGGTRQPDRDDGPAEPGPAQFRRRRERAAERLADVQRGRHVRREPRHDARGARHHPAPLVRRAGVRLQGQVLARDQGRRDVRLPAPAPVSPAEAASAHRRGRPLQEFRHAQARRRARLPADEPEPEPGLCRQPLGRRRGRRGQGRAHRQPRRVAHGSRGIRRRDGRRGLAALGRRHDGPDDAGLLSAAARQFRLPRVPEARSRRAGQRRDAGILREAQLACRLAGDRRGETGGRL